MRISLLVPLLLLASCGKRKDAVIPHVLSEELRAEVARISPLLNWCDGQAAGARPNNIDHRPNCDVGDAMAESGFLTLVGQFPQEQGILAAMAMSFGPDGQPFRAPSYVGKDTQNEFSRDQLLGLIQGTLAGLPAEQGLRRLWDYYRATGKLCPHPTDNRCWVSPSMMLLTKWALGEKFTDVERAADEVTLNTEAQTVPLTFQADLVAKHIFAIAKMNRLTASYAHAAMLLNRRAPNNLWISTVYRVTNGGKPGDFDAIGESLLSCMRTWSKPGTDWTFSHGNTACVPNVYGHELVALAHFLLRIEAEKLVDPATGATSFLLFF